MPRAVQLPMLAAGCSLSLGDFSDAKRSLEPCVVRCNFVDFKKLFRCYSCEIAPRVASLATKISPFEIFPAILPCADRSLY